jgi:hypothetical protein
MQVDAVECSTVGGARVAHVVFEQMKGLKKALTVVSKGLKTPLVCTTQGAARSKVGLKGASLRRLSLHAFSSWGGGIGGCVQEGGVCTCCL